MTDRFRLSTYAPAGVAVLLVAAHFLGFGPQPATPEKAPAARPAERPPRPDLDEAKWEQWREKHRASISDVGEARATKEFQARMRTLGTTPVEVPTGDDDHGGLFVAKGDADLQRFLAEGGHFSGPLPPHLVTVEGTRAEDGR